MKFLNSAIVVVVMFLLPVIKIYAKLRTEDDSEGTCKCI